MFGVSSLQLTAGVTWCSWERAISTAFLIPTRTVRPRREASLAADLLVAGQKDGILHFLTIKGGSLLPDERLDGPDA